MVQRTYVPPSPPENCYGHRFDLVAFHLAFAAFLAISRRFAADNAFALAGPPALPPMRAMSDSRSGVRFRARARPPLGPPSLPRATAWGFFFRGMTKPLLYGTGPA
jgi:hypothetical protein